MAKLPKCPNVKSPEFKTQKEMIGEDLAYHLWDKNNGNPLTSAPNGQPSKLYSTLLEITGSAAAAHAAKSKVYTPGFLAWFGNWIDGDANTSKVVDENGEPLVVYHGSPVGGITEFNRSKSAINPSGLREFGLYFTTNRELAKHYMVGRKLKPDYVLNVKVEIEKLKEKQSNVRNNRDWDYYEDEIAKLYKKLQGDIYPVYLNMQKIHTFDANKTDGHKGWRNLSADVGYKTVTGIDAIEAYAGKNTAAPADIKTDGILAKNIVDLHVSEVENSKEFEELYNKFGGDAYLLFDGNPTQVKSATSNDGTFSATDADIRFKRQGLEDYSMLNSEEKTQRRIDILRNTPHIKTNETRIDEDYDADDAEYNQTKAYIPVYVNKWTYADNTNPDTEEFSDIDEALLDLKTPGSLSDVNDWYEPYKETEVMFREVWLDSNDEVYDEGDVMHAENADLPEHFKATMEHLKASKWDEWTDLGTEVFSAPEASSRELEIKVYSDINKDIIKQHEGLVLEPTRPSKYRNIEIYDKEHNYQGAIQLRIANHSYNPDNNDMDAREGKFISVVIANNDRTAQKFKGRYNLHFDGENTYQEVVAELNERIIEILDNKFADKLATDADIRFKRQGLPETITINGKERPTTNSNGQPIHSTEQGVKNFYKWFGDSKVVDEKGRPLVVYHGTSDERADFNTFSNFSGRHFFSNNRDVADSYNSETNGAGIYEVYLNIKNPEIIDYKYHNWDYGKIKGYQGKTIVDIVWDIQNKKTNDGAIALNIKDPGLYTDDESFGNDYIVFSPTQIKSATSNDGTFSADDADIRFRRIPTPPVINAGMSVTEVAELVKEFKQEQKEIFTDVNREMAKISQYYTDFVDRAAPLEKYLQQMQEKGAVMTVDTNAMASYATSASRATHMIQEYQKNLIAPLQESLHKVVRSGALDNLPAYRWNVVDESTDEVINSKPISKYDRMSLYLQAKDIVEADTMKDVVDRGAKGFENNVHDANGQGVSPHKYIQEFEAAVDKSTIDTIWQQVRAINTWALDTQLAAGLITQEIYDTYTDGTRQYYVPQRGWRERDLNDSNQFYVTDTNDTPDNPFNVALVKARGRTTLAGDPLAYMQSIGESTVMAVLKNETKQVFLQFAMDNADFARHHDFFAFKKVYYINTGNIDAEGNATYERTYEPPTKEQIDEDKAIQEELKAIADIKKEAQANMQAGKIKPTAYAKLVQRHAGKERQLRNKLNVKFTDSEASRIAQVTAAERKQHTVTATREGIEYDIVFSQHYGGERVANVINRKFETGSQGKFNQEVSAAMNKGTRFMSAMMTQYNPTFALTNAIRDFGIASITNLAEQGVGYQLQFMQNIALAQRAVWQYSANNQFEGDNEYSGGKYGAMLKEFFEDGAATGWSFLKDIDQLRTDMQRAIDPSTGQLIVHGKFGLKNAMGLRQAFGMLTEASELTTRFATYITSRQQTNPDGTPKYSRKEAAIHAKEISVNFDRKGNSKMFTPFFSFFNAQVQGTNKLFRMIRDPRVRNRMIGVSASFVAFGLLQGLMMPDPEDDEERVFTEWEMMNNICIGKLKIPLPQGLRAFWGVGTQAALAMRGSKNIENAMLDAVNYFVGEFIPEQIVFWLNGIEIDDRTGRLSYDPTMAVRGIMPTTVQPAYDIWQNTNFMGGTTYRTEFTNSRLDTKAERALGKQNVSQAAQDFSNWLWMLGGGGMADESKLAADGLKTVPGMFDINPSSIETLVRGYSAGTGKFVLDMYTLTKQVIDPEAKVDISTMGFANAFWKQPRDFKPLDKAMMEVGRQTSYYKSQFQEIKSKNPERYKRIVQFHIDHGQLRREHPEQFERKLLREGSAENRAFEAVYKSEVLSKYVEFDKIDAKDALKQAEGIIEEFYQIRKK